MKMDFIRMRIKNHFHISDLKQRLKETQKYSTSFGLSLATRHQAEWSNIPLLITERIG